MPPRPALRKPRRLRVQAAAISDHEPSLFLPVSRLARASYRHQEMPASSALGSWRGVAPVDDDGLDLTGATAPEGRCSVVFRRGEAGDPLFKGWKLDNDEAAEFVWPFHEPVAAAARQYLAAEPGDDLRHQIGISLVLDGIIDLGSCNPIGRHADV